MWLSTQRGPILSIPAISDTLCPLPISNSTVSSVLVSPSVVVVPGRGGALTPVRSMATQASLVTTPDFPDGTNPEIAFHA
ncbi:hypothetical protein GCM10022419_027440 [Nonomuraea rosea]|uniref:Uncharacterized protein n=1 Tax=Nonomuraea rosea TaxID=638574 RepID=A0ABP6W338_9ACTN